jgi:GntR family transcriptional regulator
VIYRRFMISRDSAKPPWEQLADLLREKIASGELAPGDRLPSIVKLAGDYKLAGVTVRKAVVQLQREGLVESKSGWGTFVKGSER